MSGVHDRAHFVARDVLDVVCEFVKAHGLTTLLASHWADDDPARELRAQVASIIRDEIADAVRHARDDIKQPE